MSQNEKVLIGDEVYRSKGAGRLWEPDLVLQVRRHLPGLLPGWLVCSFESTVNASDFGTRKPDVALIEIQYRTWYVVEVELTSHSLRSHVIPQVEVFKYGRYGKRQARDLISANRDLPLDPERVSKLVSSVQPSITVVAERDIAEWRDSLAAIDVGLMIFQPYQSSLGRWCFRLAGDLPQTDVRLLSFCRHEPTMGRMLRLLVPSALQGQQGVEYAIQTPGGESRWMLIKTDEATFLQSVSGEFPLTRANREYRLSVRDDGGLELSPVRS